MKSAHYNFAILYLRQVADMDLIGRYQCVSPGHEGVLGGKGDN